MKGPDQHARFRIEGAHFAGCHLGAAIVGNERSHDDELPAIGRAIISGWRTDAVFTVIPRAKPDLSFPVVLSMATSRASAVPMKIVSPPSVTPRFAKSL